MTNEGVAILGSGVMAEGIARVCLQRKLDIVLLAGSPDRAEALRDRVLPSTTPGLWKIISTHFWNFLLDINFSNRQDRPNKLKIKQPKESLLELKEYI